MDNYKLVYFCQRCHREHDRTNSPMFETGVKCDFCEGYIITPSGRAMMQIKITANVYFVTGKECSAWIGSNTKKEAEEYFCRQIEPEILKTKKLSDQEVNDSLFAFDPNNTHNEAEFVWLSAKEALVTAEILPIIIYAADNKMLADVQKRFNDGDL